MCTFLGLVTGQVRLSWEYMPAPISCSPSSLGFVGDRSRSPGELAKMPGQILSMEAEGDRGQGVPRARQTWRLRLSADCLGDTLSFTMETESLPKDHLLGPFTRVCGKGASSRGGVKAAQGQRTACSRRAGVDFSIPGRNKFLFAKGGFLLAS